MIQVSALPRLRSFTAKLLASHLLVAMLTSLSLVMLIALAILVQQERVTLEQLRDETQHTLADWQRGAPADGVNARPLSGRGLFVLIVSADNVVR